MRKQSWNFCSCPLALLRYYFAEPAVLPTGELEFYQTTPVSQGKSNYF
jgi:hypothetical protein